MCSLKRNPGNAIKCAAWCATGEPYPQHHESVYNRSEALGRPCLSRGFRGPESSDPTNATEIAVGLEVGGGFSTLLEATKISIFSPYNKRTMESVL